VRLTSHLVAIVCGVVVLAALLGWFAAPVVAGCVFAGVVRHMPPMKRRPRRVRLTKAQRELARDLRRRNDVRDAERLREQVERAPTQVDIDDAWREWRRRYSWRWP
jgi:hypothetical protein